MNTTQKTTAPPSPTAPLALHIRSLRQWYGTTGLEQAELAQLAGISRQTLSHYESCRSLPPALESLLAVAFALEVPLERLIDPRQLCRLKAEVEQRRVAWLQCQADVE